MQAHAFSYRSDIDGLRAVAILPVVFFHANFSIVSGGFVGVDVFFVISGYLITSIVANEIETNTFSLAGFYERRIRRLMPSLFAMLTVTLIAGYLLLTPTDYASLNKSSLQTLIFASNFHFARLGGYFDQPLTMSPLLHTWSLAVEEQFYIVWPPLLWALSRYARAWRGTVVLALLLISLGLAILLVNGEEARAFYWPHVRAWELLVGATLALGLVPRSTNRVLTDTASVLGLAAIAFAVFTYSEETLFPGLAAIPPVLGAALVIWAGMERASIAGRLLSLPPFVFIGLISYAWYLWHWPLFSLLRGVTGREPTEVETWAIIAGSLVLATLCWHFLEKPVRRRSGIPTGQLVKFTAAGAVAIGAFSLAAEKTVGFINRFPPQIRSYTRAEALRYDGVQCKKGEVCLLNQGRDGAPGVLVWGDSHAGAVVPVFAQLGRELGVTVYLTWLPACPPLLGVDSNKTRKRTVTCNNLNQTAFDLIKQRNLTTVVLVARWNAYLSPILDANIAELRRVWHVTDAQSPAPSIAENAAVISRGLERTTTAIRAAGADIWLLKSVPDALVDVPNALARATMRGEDPARMAPIDRHWHDLRSAVMSKLAQSLDERGMIRTLDPAKLLCTDQGCKIQHEGKPLYYDDDHLSSYGSIYLKPLVQQVFQKSRIGPAATAPSSSTGQTEPR